MSKRFPLYPANERSDAKRSAKAKQLTRSYKQNREIKSRDYVIVDGPSTFYSTVTTSVR